MIESLMKFLNSISPLLNMLLYVILMSFLFKLFTDRSSQNLQHHFDTELIKKREELSRIEKVTECRITSAENVYLIMNRAYLFFVGEFVRGMEKIPSLSERLITNK